MRCGHKRVVASLSTGETDEQVEDRPEQHDRPRCRKLRHDRGCFSPRRRRIQVGLEPPKTEGGARMRILTPPSALTSYLVAVCASGLAGLALVVLLTPWPATLNHVLVSSTIFLALGAIIGEIRPVRLVTGGDGTRLLSTSSPFVRALVAVAGPVVAVLVQAVASNIDDLLNRRNPIKSLFNTAQYTLSVLAAAVVYYTLIDAPVFSPPPSAGPDQVIPLLVAGLVMVAGNWLLVAGVVSLATEQRVMSVLRIDAQQTLFTNIILVSVGGVAAVVASDGIGVLALLTGPVIGAHLFAANAARLAHDATHDSLTGLGNREQVDRALDRAFTASGRGGREGPGLVLLDLDHFKDINDTLGHPVGDRILKEVAIRLESSAPEGATVHRLGGDEFAVVIEGDEGVCAKAASDLIGSLDAPIPIEGLELLVRASAGVAVAPGHGKDGETLMKNVDIALYHAKLERDQISFFSPEFDVNTVERLRLLADLRSALETGQMHVVYQPQVWLAGGQTVAVEALVRWEHPVRGLIPPDAFIPLAENSGLIYPVTAFVLDRALSDLARWRLDGLDTRMSVNLSARHLSDIALVDQVATALDRHAIPPGKLVLEVTETGIMADAVRADAVIRAVRALGVEISIDDYGTGNASLSYLRRLEVDELKVDRSFVSRLNVDDHDRIIVRSTVELALALGLRVVAEGIEDAATAEVLQEIGDVIGQGYHLGRPVAAAEIASRLGQERSDRPPGAKGRR
jgi:diguanylate cyclase (GGDEF)-like protein